MASDVASSVACRASAGGDEPRETKATKSGRKPAAMNRAFHWAIALMAGACGSGKCAGSSRDRTICRE